jgi:O-methyltransferase
MNAFLRSLFNSAPPVKRLLESRDALRSERDLLTSERVSLIRQIEELKIQDSLKAARGTPTYDADFLMVWNKNTDFLEDPHFMRAYRAGMNSGHKIGRPAGSDLDIHIEWRIVVCCWAGWHAKHLSGDFVECGTNTGIMSLAICNYIDFNATGKNFFLYDTFQGMPEDQILPEERTLGRHLENTMYEDCFERARSNFKPFPRARLIKGKVPDTLSMQKIERVCYLMLDMNMAVPEVAAIEYFWDKLVPGALVLFDDYGWLAYIQQKKAMDSFAASKGVKILTLPTGQGLLIKP